MFDITMLLRLVDRLTQENANAKLYWVDIASIAEHDRYLGFGALTGEQLAPYRDTAILLTAERIEWMRSAWIAYTSPNPLKIAQWVNDASSVSAPFCAIREALQFHLSRYPSVQDGMGIVERITLHAVKDGTASFQQCYDIVRKQLPEYGLGDLQFWGYLRRLTSGDAPLLELSPSSSPLPEPFQSSAANDGQLFVTDNGQQVLNGTLNWAQAGGYGRWLGGAFITRTAVGIK
ncbi:RNA polymerase subunit sigma [Paenibacillus alvei]|uniref:RNA polymerase subunit sigma n=1 Tax=Paenibacillus alvei TaxID=44250 RepID=UPI001EE68C97|nr:RNA polymerase subunit sigma [Paenibacillus alvei]